MKKRIQPIYLAIIGIAGVCLAGGLFIAYNASQLVVSCPSAPKTEILLPTPATAQDYYAHGDYDYDHGNCDLAIADYTRAIELDSSLAEAYNNRAYVYMVKRNYALALLDLDRAIQLRPNYVNALMNRGDIYNYYYSINYERAVADYDRVLQIDPLAAKHTSVCGHRLLATQHGWNPDVIVTLLANHANAGCSQITQ